MTEQASTENPTRWLITGGCGFLGTRLIQSLQEQGGHAIRVLDNLSVGTREDLAQVTDFKETTPQSLNSSPDAAELVVGDILDAELALAVARDRDVIVHFAANTGVPNSVENPRMDCEANVLGTFNYLEAARHNRVRRFVFASSGAPAGIVEPPIHEELPAHPVSPYGASKLAGEGYCSAYYHCYGVETVTLRFGNVYGPGSKHKSSVVAKFIRQALDGETCEIYGDGSQTRDFIYIDDLIDAVIKAANTPGIGGEIFQIATSRESTVAEVARMIQKELERTHSDSMKIVFSEPRRGDVSRNFSDTKKARTILGWNASTDLPEGIAKTLTYFLKSANSTLHT
ncbi:MAG TPA: NAD-dependent epimerase/dehydratase family protein [Gammaproteobacteria bacterium]|nr:NAD-dependent epimerase/dehydratase family protein [Gammaproteobacteria bacterium]